MYFLFNTYFTFLDIEEYELQEGENEHLKVIIGILFYIPIVLTQSINERNDSNRNYNYTAKNT